MATLLAPVPDDVFLSTGQRGETANLTGARQRRTQMEALNSAGIPYVIGRDGYPRVAREWVKTHLAAAKPERPEDEPDFTTLKSARR